MRLIVWIILVLASVIGGAFLCSGGNIGMYIDPISILIVFVPTWGALLVGFKGYLIKSITSIWKTDVDSQTLGQCAEVWRASNKYAITFGFLGVLLGLIPMFGNLEDLSKLSPSLAVALIPILYGLFWGAIVASPIAHLLEAKQKQNPTS